jgi:hypothetical protein
MPAIPGQNLFDSQRNQVVICTLQQIAVGFEMPTLNWNEATKKLLLPFQREFARGGQENGRGKKGHCTHHKRKS